MPRLRPGERNGRGMGGSNLGVHLFDTPKSVSHRFFVAGRNPRSRNPTNRYRNLQYFPHESVGVTWIAALSVTQTASGKRASPFANLPQRERKRWMAGSVVAIRRCGPGNT